jgi:adenosylhomocysteine nucleosidase
MNDIILIAIKEEAPALASLPNVFFTGVGKVNAALNAARLIEKHRPRRIWNFGTAGGITVEDGLHRCTRFLQRDMLVTALGFSPGQTPYEDAIALELGKGGLTCSSGDSFVTDSSLHLPADIVDMEAYALAKACHLAGVEFHCYKFISDRADGASSSDWTANVCKGEPCYQQILRKHGLYQG